MSKYFVGTAGANNQTTFGSLTTSEVLDDLQLNTTDSPTFNGLTVGNHIVPDADNEVDLGTTNSKDFRTLYIREIDVFNERLRIDGNGLVARFRDHGSVGDGFQFLHLGTEILRLGNGSSEAATFAGSVTAASLIKSGGTSSQFLKADGSVDSNTYVSSASLSSYLPLAGGTMSGHILLNNGIELRSKDTSSNVKTIARINSSNQLEYGWSGGGPVKFMGGGSYTERMRIHSDGNVGIGTTTPATPLHVTGEVRVDATEGVAARKIRSNYFSSGQNLDLVCGASASLILGDGTARLTLASDDSATFAGSVTATSLIKSGGTSSQFLKADGSVDSNSYSTTSHNHTLDSLSNVTITSNTSGEVLRWSGSAWINSTLSEAGIQASSTALTTSTTFGGDVSGTYNAIVVANDSHTHNANNLTGTTLASGVTASSLTSVGTITSGEWNGSVIASAYLDSDTAHLSGTQTFSGQKTFDAANTYINNDLTVYGAAYFSQYLYHAGDTDTFIRFQTNDINLSAAGQNMLRVDGNSSQKTVVVNEVGIDADFRVESSGEANALFVRGSDGNVGIHTNAPDYELHVIGTASFTDTVAGAYFEENASNPELKELDTGTILTMDEEGEIVPSCKANDTMVFGASKRGYKQPIVMGAEPIKMTGPIKVGDFITTSSRYGHGMRSETKEVGTIIAQAMESGDGDSYNIKAMIRKM